MVVGNKGTKEKYLRKNIFGNKGTWSCIWERGNNNARQTFFEGNVDGGGRLWAGMSNREQISKYCDNMGTQGNFEREEGEPPPLNPR